MRKMNKGKVLLAALLALLMLLGSFPVVCAENPDIEFSAVEMMAEAPQTPEEVPGFAQESALEPDFEAEFAAAGEEPVAEAEMAEVTDEMTTVETGIVEVSEEMAEAEIGTAEVPEETAEAEIGTAEVPEETTDAEAEAAEASEEATAAEPETGHEEEPVPETIEEETEDIPGEAEAEDAGAVSDEPADETTPEADQEFEFTGTIEIELKDSEIVFGGDVTLVAVVTGADTLNYRLVWEANDGDDRGWYAVGSGAEYTFTMTEDIVDREYRVMLIIAD